MSRKTIREFAEVIHFDKKKLEDKLRYQKTKFGIDFGSFSEGVKYLSDDEQMAICELLGIPIFLKDSSNISVGTEKISKEEPINSSTVHELEILKISNEMLTFKNEILENQLSEIRSDKQKQEDSFNNQLSELNKANSEMRILLQQNLKTIENVQVKMSEISLEMSKIKVKENPVITGIEEHRTTTEKTLKSDKKEVEDIQVQEKKKNRPMRFVANPPEKLSLFQAFQRYDWKYAYHAWSRKRQKYKEWKRIHR